MSLGHTHEMSRWDITRTRAWLCFYL